MNLTASEEFSETFEFYVEGLLLMVVAIVGIIGNVLFILLFSCHANKNRHMRIHDNTFPYTCETCGQRFRHTNSLKDHMRRHTGEKPFACKICKKSFT